MPVGGMIEVPAAALAIDEFASELDFISIGTNDLLQYALAADRGDEEVAHLYDLQHPGIVRLIRYILREADHLGLPAAICGEAAGDPRYTRLLLALGLRQVSMHPENPGERCPRCDQALARRFVCLISRRTAGVAGSVASRLTAVNHDPDRPFTL